VSFTLAALPANTRPDPYPYPTAIRYIETAKRLLGAKRLMWGSDVPTTLVFAKYHEQIDFLADSHIFGEDELKDIYSENAKRIYRL
jgi:predicted TIM-barrel fold metal-dependent hydrolase